MNTVISADGTSIAFDRIGEGTPVVLVSGASTDRSFNTALAEQLATHFTVYNYDRRGRGDSGDTAPYAVDREIEDLAAVIGAAGGPAAVWGTSSGAALALLAAAHGLPMTRVAAWEPPYILDGSRPRPPADTADIYTELVAAGRRGDAVEYFMTKVVGLPPEMVAGIRQAPFWAGQEAMAHTLAYDATVVGDYRVPIAQLQLIDVPTIVLDGGASPDWLRDAARAVADAIPNGRHRTLPGQEHHVDPTVLAPALVEFFTA